MSENNYTVLARKYRPQNFAGLIGQESLVQTLTNAIKSNRIAHAFLLTGIRGVGKTTTARIIAKALNCTGNDDIEPCGTCQSCTDISADRHMDVIEMDAASNTGVDDVREIIESAKYAPNSAKYKVYIIDEVHMLSNSAFNALLKTLEEPPANVKFIFATTELHKVPVTILSRCQKFYLNRVEDDQLEAHLQRVIEQEGVQAESEALKIISSIAEGSVRDSLSLLDQAISYSGENVTASSIRDMVGMSDRAALFDLFEQTMQGNINEALDQYSQIAKVANASHRIFQDLLEVCHLITKAKLDPEFEDKSVASNDISRARDIAAKIDMGVLQRTWQMLLKGLGEVKTAPQPSIAGEMVLIRLAHMAELPDPSAVIEYLKGNKKKA